jgi:predicted nucleic acid-binding protein
VTVLADTSALYASLDRSDPDHGRARDAFAERSVHDLMTHSYVVLETDALVRRRLGLRASRVLHETILAPLEIVFVDAALHQAAVAAYLGGGKNGPSLVDCASFAVMRAHGIRTALAFDRHFSGAGFDVVP